MYDNNGNIIKRREFVFTLKDNTLIEELESIDKAYIYNGDQMVAYNGQTCVYDVMGNPTTYRGKTATWINGRRLASYDGHTFTYDGQGRRLAKDSVVFAYDSNGRLIKQGDNMEFFYDQTGVVGLKYSGTTYLYRKDAQNNVIALINESGVIVAIIGGIIATFIYGGPAIASFLGKSFQIGAYVTAAGELVAVTVTGAQIAVAGLAALAAMGIMFSKLPKHGGPLNGTLSNDNSIGYYDGNGNLTERYDFKGEPHFIKELGEYRLPHTHHYRWRFVEGVWQRIKYWITG